MCTVHLSIIGEKTANPQNTACTISLATKTKVFGTQGSDLLAAGEERTEKDPFVTEKLDYKTDWFLKLNPKGAGTKDCDAWGYMRNA